MLMNIKINKQVLLASWLNIGHLLCGYAGGWTAPVLPMLRDPQRTVLPYSLSHIQTSWIASLVFVGVIIGPFLVGYVSNSRGRQPCLVIGGITITMAYVMKTIPIGVWTLYAARIFTGLGVGIIITTNLIYLTEIASTKLRGILLSTTGTSSSLGTLIVYSIAPYAPYVVTGYVGITISLIFTVGLAFLPESPVFYVLKNENAKAKEILEDLNRPNDIDDLISTKTDSITLIQQIKQIFGTKSNRRATFILVTLNTLQGLSGCLGVLFFSTSIFDMARTTHDSNVSTIVIGIALLASSCLTPIIVERCGRKMLLLISTAICCGSLISLGTCFFLDEIDHPSADSIEYLPIISLMTFLISYNIGFAIIPATFTGEMFDSSVRGSGSSFTLCVGWIVSFITTTTFAYMVSTIGAAITFWVYASACAIAFIFTVVFVPETKVYIGQMLIGYGLGWTAPVIPKLQDPEQTPLPNVITEGEASFIGSVLYIGTITGPYITSFLSNIVGRKPCLYLAGGITFMSFLVLAISRNLAMILTGRILAGVGTGIIAIMHLVYIGEIASTKIRGILLTALAIFGTFGTLVVYAVGPYVPYSATGYMGCGICILYIIGVIYIPETPVFQVLKGQDDQAKKTLVALGREDVIQHVVTAKQGLPKPTKKSEWFDLIKIKSNRNTIFITLSLGILLQMSGVVVVIFFATTIFELAGSSIEPNIATIIIGVTQTCASSITPFFVERSGRKPLLLFSSAACCVSLAVLGLYFFLNDINHSIVPSIKWLPLVSLIIFFLCFDLAISPIERHLSTAPGYTLVSTMAWLAGFGVSTAFGYMVPVLGGHGTFWIYAASCALATFFVPETKEKTLLEIQEMLNK